MISASVAHSSCFPFTQAWEGERRGWGSRSTPYPFGREKIRKRTRGEGEGRGKGSLDCPLGASHMASFPEATGPALRSHCLNSSLGPGLPRSVLASSLPGMCCLCPDFDLTLIPWLVRDHSSGPFGGMIRMRE